MMVRNPPAGSGRVWLGDNNIWTVTSNTGSLMALGKLCPCGWTRPGLLLYTLDCELHTVSNSYQFSTCHQSGLDNLTVCCHHTSIILCTVSQPHHLHPIPQAM